MLLAQFTTKQKELKIGRLVQKGLKQKLKVIPKNIQSNYDSEEEKHESLYRRSNYKYSGLQR